MLKTTLLLAAMTASAANALASSSEDYASEIEAWRVQRAERLKAPNGWLSLVGLDWLMTILYPDAKGEDLRTAAGDFYHLFYHVDPTDAEIDTLLGDFAH